MPSSSTESSSLLLYGVLDAAACEDEALHAPLDHPGVQGASLSLLSCGPLSVLVSPVDDPAALEQPDVDEVLAYKEAVDNVYETRPLLPLRFGTQAQTSEEARRLVRDRADACKQQLGYLKGRVEMGIRLELSPSDASALPEADSGAASGTAYLQSRKETYARTQRPLREGLRAYREALDELWVDASYDEPGLEETVLSIAFLVPRRDADAFVRRAETVERPAEVNDVEVVGPWAPFTFASLTL
jgi:hypothetical protein